MLFTNDGDADMQTVTVSVRIPRAEANRWGRLAEAAGLDRASLLKQALRTGCDSALFERACAAYRRGGITLSRAAEMAGIGQRELLARMSAAGLEIRYDARSLDRDLSP
jgi:hypothetical protein